MRFRALSGCLAALLSTLHTNPAIAAKRVALVAGIDRYDNLDRDRQLQKAVNDARAIGAALEKLGFVVTISENAGRIELVRAWSRFLGTIEPGDTAAFFFAGHGIELGGVNFLVPRDVPTVGAGEEEVLKEASIRVATLMEGLRDKSPQVSLVILDACRDNPFVDAAGRSLGAGRGLARVEPARGTFVMFSADAGQQALDRLSNADADPNSVYTRSLLPLLATPGLGLRGIAVEVRDRVNRLAKTVGEDQFPAYYDAMQSDLVLAGPKVAAAAPEPADDTSVEPSAPLAEEARIWPTIEATASCGVLDSFVGRFPASIYADFARARQTELGCGEEKVAVAAPEASATAVCSGTLAKVGDEDRCLKPGDVFRDFDVAPEMVVVPAGTFTMGSPANEEGRDDGEGPQHDVTIDKPFAVGKLEVTRGQYAAFVKATGRKTGDSCLVFNGTEWKDTSGKSWRDPGYQQSDDHPVVCINWDDAKAYVAWLANETGKGYRLLSEAEWEYAARGQTKPGSYPRFHFGDRASELCDYANGADKSTSFDWANTTCSDGVGAETAPAGRYKANGFGLHDMHGNVWEWTEDCYVDSYNGAPRDGSARTTGDCSQRVLRGGAWVIGPRGLRAAARSRVSSGLRGGSLGFRLGRTLNP